MNPIRTIVERFSRGRSFKRSISVKGKNVGLFVTPDARLQYLKLGKQAFDSDLIDIAEKFLKPDSVVWDIGANVGVFTFAAAAVAHKGSVISIEADIWLASLLRRSVQLESNSGKDIRVLPLAISDSDTISTFLIAKRGRASNALEAAGGRSQMGGVREKQFVPTLCMDSLLESVPSPDFIKVDVEGAELMVTRGALKVIEKVRPVFYMEVGANVSEEIAKIFQEHKYLLFSPAGEVLVDKCAANTFFIPIENTSAQKTASSPMVNPQC